MENIDNSADLAVVSAQLAYLKEFISEDRYARLASRLDFRTRYMLLGLEDIFYPHNASATIRSAEAFGLQEVHAVEHFCPFSPSRDIVRGTDQWVDIHKWSTTKELISHLRGRGYRIVVTAPRENGATLESFDVSLGKFALFMGTEKSGISDWLIEQADDSIYIPMVGFAESLNISVSAAIIIQELTSRIRKMDRRIWSIQNLDQQRMLLKWVKSSIKDVDNILKRFSL